jgi:integrase
MGQRMIEAVRRYKGVIQDRDRHGNLRTYLRRPGLPKVRLHEAPGTDAFDAEYRAALAETPAPKPRRTTAREGTVDALIRSYYGSTEFRTGLATRSQQVRRLILEGFRDAKGKDGLRHGDRTAEALPSAFLERQKDSLAETPEAFNSLLKALRAAYAAGMRLGLVTRNPAASVGYLPSANPEGWHTWTPAEIAQFLERWPIGSKPALALAILYWLGVRRSNAVTLGPQHVRDGQRIEYRPVKGSKRNPRTIRLPYPAELRAAVEATPHGRLTWLITEHGQPYTADGFGNAFRRWCRMAGLPHCGPHGLRKARAVDRAHAGASDREMMAAFGWSSAKEPARYTRMADQERLAAAAWGRGEVSHFSAGSGGRDKSGAEGVDSTGPGKGVVPGGGVRKTL